MTHHNRYNRPKSIPEKPSGISRVEVAGYIPAHIKIKSLIDAGARLIQSRKEQFDFPAGSEPDQTFFDPTRRKGLDRTDVDAMRSALEKRLTEHSKTAKIEEIKKDTDVKEAVLDKVVLDTK